MTEKNPGGMLSETPEFHVPICTQCAHWFRNSSCRAFDYIPDEIMDGRNDHAYVFPGQKENFVFTPISGTAPK